MAKHTGSGHAGPAIHGRAFGNARANGSQAHRRTRIFPMPSLAQRIGSGQPGLAIHGQAFGATRASGAP
ncbi:hypothetical protein ACFOPN_09690 [Xanthomonas hyacinthi]|uniref:hypothetical protein n=1 Tax=Xanthomonas hyacinthi TaxID=56455 RepID=UPI003607935A